METGESSFAGKSISSGIGRLNAIDSRATNRYDSTSPAFEHEPMFDYVPQRLLFISLQIAIFCGMLTGGNVISGRDNDFFPSRKHDFGTVARGSKTIHKFNIQNPFDQPLVISGVRSSCGCTRATVPEKVIAPRGIGFVLAEFNTRSFLGKKSATITVVLAEPTRREIQLRVTGNIRGDIVLEPGELVIPKIRQGESQTVSTEIHHAGDESWKIIDVKSSLKFLTAELEELERRRGSVRYTLKVTMEGDFPEGQVRDALTLVTSDRVQRQVPLSFTARVVPLLSVSPQELEFRSNATDTSKMQKRLILKSDQAFRITKVSADDKRLEIKFGDVSRKTQVVTVTFQPIQGVSVPQIIPIRLETDLGRKYSRTINARIGH